MPSKEKGLPEKLIELDGFQELYQNLLLQSVGSQFPLISKDYECSSIDWNYMLKCASVLAKSEVGVCQDAALRIAQYCLNSEPEHNNYKIASAIILDTLTNTPSLKLAMRRNLIPKNFEENIPFPLHLDMMQRRIKFSILNSEDYKIVSINRFQKSVYDSAQNNQWLSISAPTSAGKSFILRRIVEDSLIAGEEKNIVFMVPTRALIQQVEFEIIDALNERGLDNVFVSSVPSLPNGWNKKRIVLILTQERLQWLLSDYPTFKPHLLIVDEAQKIGDGTRGVLLEQVIEETRRRNNSVRVYFSSPMTENPEFLLKQAPENSIKHPISSEQVAVNQNLIWVSQVSTKAKQWQMELCYKNEILKLGKFEVSDRPARKSMRLPIVAFSLASKNGGNLIYVNGAADAEKTALQLWTLQGKACETDDEEIVELINLVKKVINKNYTLVQALGRRVAFHYGNMPLLVRNEIERLFTSGKIHFLVCTSTLIEGVNLPAKTIFLRGPKKGMKKPMSEIDFWNLAGRAGRQGKEFQGNVICIDPNDKVWGDGPPRNKRKYPITSTIKEVLQKKGDDLVKFISDGTPRKVAASEQELEYTFTYLLGERIRYDELKKSPVISRYPSSDEIIDQIEHECAKVLEKIEIPKKIIYRNPGISPIAQQSLLDYFSSFERDYTELIPALPESEEAYESYVRVIGRISKHLSGDPPQLNEYRAVLVTNWMRGYGLAWIIERNWGYWRKRKDKKKTLPSVIRETMRDIEEFARFKFAKYSSCYIDILKYFLEKEGFTDLAMDLPKLNIWLEFGASQQTQISLMSLGLSRTTAIALSELIVHDNYNTDQCLEWLNTVNLESLELSPIIIQEVMHILIGRNS
ncbi:DEAD/DEAH box helicase [Brevibacillus fulvus]|uniref:DEAD/DEAH box helicase n=1 Tax=Brevibacillus fulvus TaxID=1125967 RepID=A0A939BTF7_9BACL|nr:DEAD/DEAH box helicase [Brevibacillus fulvus]MBM7591782.1 hypothetical protein [Brevibacillus fulvus]